MMMMSNAGLHRVHASKPPGDLLQSSLITAQSQLTWTRTQEKLNHKHFSRTNETNRPYFGRAKNMETGSVQLLHSFFKCLPEFPFLIQNTCLHFPKKYTCDDFFPFSLSNEEGKTEVVVENYKTYPR